MSVEITCITEFERTNGIITGQNTGFASNNPWIKQSLDQTILGSNNYLY